MAEKIFGQIDSVASVVVRIVDVIYGRRDLVGYELEYKPEVGVLSYNQVFLFVHFPRFIFNTNRAYPFLDLHAK